MKSCIFVYLVFAYRVVSSGDVDEEYGRGISSSYSAPPQTCTLPTFRSTLEFVKPEQPPKLFGIDFDETFYSLHDKDAFKKNVEAFAEAKKKEFIPFFCTGRSRDATFRLVGDNFVTETNYNGYPGVYQNGALVYDENGNVIYSQPLSKEFIRKTCELVTSNPSTGAVLFTRDGYYSPAKVTDPMSRYIQERELPDPEIKTTEEIVELEIYKIYLAANHLDFPGFEQGKDYVAKVDLPGSWDIGSGDLNKALGLKKLMEHYGIPPEECAFIGNGDNDIEAMELSNLSFAVGNAPAEVKKHAKIVLDKTCDQGAVAEALGLVYSL
ncbi:haloacid dehalogenase-like hydrolase family member protein [Theileria equi strain WA]|uniref:Haloacid dehalogenase-like hydrolase family member protein n=1 Tax=Theileria equi strain WA TaxID=1537102 RepID=L1LFA4_THEEQ|nr:haloacid dehalogenase-like hydrolase family member protein [Theileria equi strain WA]EKX73959.1 haloacid dehalogenase-like hydrolase family member protein [Theileria equi strain WA]|eukprot:XP_004833411.1 haloacid dehalogenase-like hydrolase family member protein [Theileria equi strain WA]